MCPIKNAHDKKIHRKIRSEISVSPMATLNSVEKERFFNTGWRQNEHFRVKMMYSLEECVFLVSKYFLTDRNLNAMRTEFGKRFNVHSRKLPAKSVIQRLVAKFEKTGSMHDDKRRKVGPK